MAKVVSTKFGDRRLVYLPPINLTGVKTANVETIQPAGTSTIRYRYGDGGKKSQKVPKEYAYRERGHKNRQRQPWLGSPINAIGEGNLVDENANGSIGDAIFQQLYQKASTNSLKSYSHGQYPVLPAVSGEPHYMQYTNHGLANMSDTQPPPNAQPQAQPSPQTKPALPVDPAGSNPNEKHIYYGPNGEVLPGPPHSLPQPSPVVIQDFAFEGLLRNGRLVAVSLIDGPRGFPKIPDILVKDLFEKYGQFDETVVRVVARRGQFYVHATPNLPQPDFTPRGGPHTTVLPEYVPVYLEDDEEFDFDKFIRNYQHGNYPLHNGHKKYRVPARRYRTPPLLDRNNEILTRDRSHYSPDISPSVYDPVSHLRWQKDDRRWTSDSRRVVYTGRPADGRQTASDSGQFTYNKYKGRKDIYTRDDIRPIESIKQRRYRD